MDGMSVIEQMVDYSRQSEMRINNGILVNRVHYIVGCGGIGYWTAIFLALLGAGYLVLIDGDKIEPSNMARLPVPLRWRDMFKVRALKITIRLLRPTTNITCIPMHFVEETLNAMQFNRGMIWDCTDDARIQKIIATRMNQFGIGLYHKMSYEGWNVAGYNAQAFSGLWIDEEYRAGYTTNQANVLSSVIASALGIMNVLTRDGMPSYEINLEEMLCHRTNGQ